MTTLYEAYLKGTTHYDYDTRIDEYNWKLIFLTNFGFYFIFHAALRKYLPEPGPRKVYEERKKMHEYHTYYFNYTSLFHALFGCIMGKSYKFEFQPHPTKPWICCVLQAIDVIISTYIWQH
jgi:hypothetical protein